MANDPPTPDPSPAHRTDASATSSLDKLTRHPIVASIIASIAAALILATIFGIGRSSDPPGQGAPTGADSTPDNVMEEVAARPFWASTPRLYKGADEQPDSDSGVYEGSVLEGDAVAVTPQDLIERASRYEGKSVYLVGKVVGEEDLNTKHGLTTEYHLRSRSEEFDAYIAQDDRRTEAAPNGGVVYALGRLAAAGESTDSRGRRIKTAYFFCFNFCEFDLVDDFLSPTRSPAIRRATRGLRSSSSVIQMDDAP